MDDIQAQVDEAKRIQEEKKRIAEEKKRKAEEERLAKEKAEKMKKIPADFFKQMKKMGMTNYVGQKNKLRQMAK